MVHVRHFYGLISVKNGIKRIVNLVLAAGDMLAGAQKQIVAAGHVEFLKLTTIELTGSNYPPGGLSHAYGACLTLFL